MATRVCAVDGCDRPARTRGWCATHYTRWRRHGDPLPAAPPTDPAERFWARVDRAGGAGACWPWRGGRNAAGQGYAHWAGRSVPAWRVAAFLAAGTWPAGLRRNRCGDRACANPAHWARPAGQPPPAPRVPPAACKRGHPWTPATTIVRPGRRGRQCRLCQQATQRAYHARKRARALARSVAPDA
jgi:hypothetical protein